ncbi:MAG: hypothetical protein RL481_1975 [Pseudomonadota bacterium]|jgi:predicted small lipoprotein YifL
MTKAGVAGLIMFAALSGCGKVGPLQPQAGQAPPAKAYGQSEAPAPDTMMTPSEQARPGRSDELMRRSERRINDPFDLPPGSETEEKDAATAPTESTTKPK